MTEEKGSKPKKCKNPPTYIEHCNAALKRRGKFFFRYFAQEYSVSAFKNPVNSWNDCVRDDIYSMGLSCHWRKGREGWRGIIERLLQRT